MYPKCAGRREIARDCVPVSRDCKIAGRGSWKKERGTIGLSGIASLLAVIGIVIIVATPLLNALVASQPTDTNENPESSVNPSIQENNNTQNNSWIYLAWKRVNLNVSSWPVDNINCTSSCWTLNYSVSGPYLLAPQNVRVWVDTQMSEKTQNITWVYLRNLGEIPLQLIWVLSEENSTNLTKIYSFEITVSHQGAGHHYVIIQHGNLVRRKILINLEPNSQALVKFTVLPSYSPGDYTASICFDEYYREL